MHSVANYNVNINNITPHWAHVGTDVDVAISHSQIKAVAIYMVSVYRDECESRLG